jgi:NADPH:quinone reductase
MQLRLSRNAKMVRSKQDSPARTQQDSVPRTMRAVAIDRNGGPEVLTLHNLPVPELSRKEVLIAVHTAWVGGWDTDIRDGWSPGGRIRFPLVLGTDGSGIIVQLGAGAHVQDR